MRFLNFLSLVVLTLLCLAGPVAARAGFTTEGDIGPATDPGTWTSSTDAYIGNTGSGSLTVDGGSDLLSHYAFFGSASSASGVANVTGGNSSWAAYTFYIGYIGSGTLSISNGGSASGSGSGAILGASSWSSGVLMVDGAGSTWNGPLSVGSSGNGTLSITNGASVNSSGSGIAGGGDSVGIATVDGAGSTWTNASSLTVGLGGSGTLNILNHSTVSAGGPTYLGYFPGSSGKIDFGPSGGTLTTGSFAGSPDQLTGAGTINTRGIISDIDLKFDSSDHLSQAIALQQAGQNVTLNLDMTQPANNGFLGAGWRGAGSLTVENGVKVQSTFGYVGYGSGSAGLAVVAGSGSSWNTTSFYVGSYGSGTLSLSSGGRIASSTDSYIGCSPGSTGVVNVDGAGSAWTCNGALNIGGRNGGSAGAGTLSITHGGTVTSGGSSGTCLGYDNNSIGVVTVDGTGSTWTDTGNVFVGLYGSGTISIRNGGSVNSPVVLLGNSTPAKGVVAVDGQGSVLNGGATTVGYLGSGTLSVTGGGSVSSTVGMVARGVGHNGNIIIDGAGSTWNDGGILIVGDNGNGILSITNGGNVCNTTGFVSYYSGSTGAVRVDGAGSKWTNSGGLYVGYVDYYCNGTATVAITGGGAVSAATISSDSASLIAIDVGRGSTLTVGGGTGSLSSSTLRVLAAANIAAGDYKPIFSGAWGGNTFQGVGGRLNTGTHTLTVSPAGTGTSGSAVSIDLTSTQRVLIADDINSAPNWKVGASFLPGYSSITFTATPISDTVLAVLTNQLPSNESILSDWMCSADGYTVSGSNPIYLSFNVGAGLVAEDLDLWHYDANGWAEFSPNDLTYDGTFASFTATSLSGYAMAAAPAVPEPGTLALLAAGVLVLLGCVWRQRKER